MTACGGLMTHHAMGIYSTTMPTQPWVRPADAYIQGRMDALQRAAVAEIPNGVGTIETYTVVFQRDKPFRGILVGYMDGPGEDKGKRFVATTIDQGTMAEMQKRELLFGQCKAEISSPGGASKPSTFKLLPSANL